MFVLFLGSFHTHFFVYYLFTDSVVFVFFYCIINSIANNFNFKKFQITPPTSQKRKKERKKN